MGHLESWKVLEKMVADFRKKGKSVPSEVMVDLKSARTLIRVAEAGASHAETYPQIEGYLANVEAYLVSEGERSFGKEYVDEWLKRLNEASRMIEAETGEKPFVSGVPREEKWVRITPSTEMSIEKLKALASATGLSCQIQEGGSLVVYGKDEDVKAFVKKMTTEYGLKTRK
ncbi:MAG: DUF2096 family protein [Candidatus Bathyarchaeia archaeon]